MGPKADIHDARCNIRFSPFAVLRASDKLNFARPTNYWYRMIVAS
jgi:hypothetical protein